MTSAKSNDNNEYMSVADYAKAIGITRTAALYRIQKGQVEATRIGRAWAIKRSALSGAVTKEK